MTMKTDHDDDSDTEEYHSLQLKTKKRKRKRQLNNSVSDLSSLDDVANKPHPLTTPY